MPVEQHTDGMHEHHPQQAIAQMPQISRPHAIGSAAIGQLAKDRTPTVCRLRDRFPEGSQQHHTDLAQSRLQGRQPIVVVAQEQPTGLCRHVPDHLAFMDIGRSQVHLGDHAGPTQPHVQAKAIEGLAAGMIFAIAGHVVEAMAAVRSHKLADRDGHTIDDGHGWIIEHQAVTHQAPQAFFDGPQVGGLPYKRRPIHLRHRWEKVRIVAAEIVKPLLILTQTQIRSHDFHHDDFAIGQLWHRPALAQALPFRGGWQHLANYTEKCDNKVVQVHGVPPHPIGKSSEDSRLHEPFSLQELLAHRVN